MPRRILAVWLERLALDRWRHEQGCPEGKGADARAFALIADSAHGPRIHAANAAGLAAGVQGGMRLTEARALCPHLALAPSDPAGDLDCLERLALQARRWGPWSAADPPDGIIVDITGVAHLFHGEEGLLADARASLARWGFAARMAVAPTVGAAWAMAHYGPRSAILAAADDMAERLRHMPVAALRLDDDVLLVLRRLGLKRFGDLCSVGRDALMRRFRDRRSPAASPSLRLDQLLGRAPEPLLPVMPMEIPQVQRRLLEPIRHRPLLDRVVADCAEDMARMLEGLAQGARRLELSLWRVDGDVLRRSLELAAASRDPAHICRLFATKLDDLDAGFGMELVRLRAVWAQPLALVQSRLDRAEQGGTSLAACIDRLTVRLGEQAVSRPAPCASHVPERAQRWIPPLEPGAAAQDEPATPVRPLKLLDRPERIAVLYPTPDGLPRRFRWRGCMHEIARAEGPERIAPEWWRERSTARIRDYYRIEDEQGRRYWIYRHGIAGDGRGGVPDWFLHGLFA